MPEFCLLGIDWWPLCMQKAEWAGWAQAVFSVAAIVAAIAIAWWQRHSDRNTALFAARVRAEVAATSILLKIPPILECCSSIHRQLTERNAHPIVEIDIAQSWNLLNRLDYPREPELMALVDHDPRTARLLIEGRDLIRQAWLALGLLKALPDPDPALDHQLPELIRFFETSIDRFQKAEARVYRLVPSEGQ